MVANDVPRDLYVFSFKGRVRMLFEAKTDLSTSSIYGAVGQLMLHAAVEPKEPRLIFVAPGTPKPKTHHRAVRADFQAERGHQETEEHRADIAHENFGGMKFQRRKPSAAPSALMPVDFNMEDGPGQQTVPGGPPQTASPASVESAACEPAGITPLEPPRNLSGNATYAFRG